MKEVLIVDDQKEMLDLYTDFFKTNFGRINLTFSSDGIEAYMKTSFQKFDAIILDHEMPRLKGLELLVAIRKTLSLNQTTPIIIISGYFTDVCETEPSFENVLFLSKPFNVEALFSYLQNHTSLERLAVI